MNLRLKAMGLAFLSILAVGPVLASQARAVQFHSEAAHTIMTGAQTTAYEFTVGAGFATIKCSKVITTGTTTAATETEGTGVSEATGCTDSLGRTVHIQDNGCSTRFHATTEKSPGSFSGDADLICPAGKDKVVTITNSSGVVVCTLTAQPQENMGPATIQNEGNKLKVTLEVTNVKLTTSGGFFNCGVANGQYSTATAKGTSTVTGTNTEGKEVKIWLG